MSRAVGFLAPYAAELVVKHACSRRGRCSKAAASRYRPGSVL